MSANIQAIEHITRDGERWDTIAWHYYGNPHDYGRIIAANPAVDISATLPANLRLLIPVLSRDEVNLAQSQTHLPPWKRDV